MARNASDILNPSDGGPGAALNYIADSVQQARTERIARAQKMKSYLQSQGYSDAEMIANPQMRTVYMESIGMSGTQAGTGPRRGPLGILPPKREQVSAEQATQSAAPKSLKSIFPDAEYMGQFGEQNPSAVTGMIEKAPQMASFFDTPGNEIKRKKMIVDEEYNKARAMRLRQQSRGLDPEKVRDMAVKAVDEELKDNLEYKIMSMSDSVGAEAVRQEKIMKTLYYYEQGKFESSVDELNKKYGINK